MKTTTLTQSQSTILLQALDAIKSSPDNWITRLDHNNTQHSFMGFVEVIQDFNRLHRETDLEHYIATSDYGLDTQCRARYYSFNLSCTAWDILTHDMQTVSSLEYWVNHVIKHNGNIVIDSENALSQLRNFKRLNVEDVCFSNVNICIYDLGNFNFFNCQFKNCVFEFINELKEDGNSFC